MDLIQPPDDNYTKAIDFCQNFMKKVFIVKSKNLINGEVKELSSYAFKDYKTAVNTLSEKLINERVNLMEKEYNNETDMTTILKGIIEVYITKKGQLSETFNAEPIKTYNYNF